MSPIDCEIIKLLFQPVDAHREPFCKNRIHICLFSFYVNRSSAHFIEKNVPEATSLRDTFLSSYILLISLDCRLNQMRRTLNPVSVRHLRQRPCHLHRDKAAGHLRIAADRHIVVEQDV